FPSNQSRFSQSRHRHAPAACEHQFQRALELFVEPLHHLRNRFRLDPQHPPRRRQTPARLFGLARLSRLRVRLHRAFHSRVSAAIFRSFSASGLKFPSASAFAPSDSAFAGFSCTSIKIPSTPAATPARASGSMNSGCPPLDLPSPPGSCTECVTSKTTGYPSFRRIGNERMSTTRFL